ncbi:hypothetical protein [Solidesulfovibrio sp.]|uniref:hypothetical protein n=1 Tax=Solidesulfovibrio sp. TaxID=2910990 RepID=UPI00261DD2CC|nr:hypothetical protein [Solidesulfovibrio sp.]
MKRMNFCVSLLGGCAVAVLLANLSFAQTSRLFTGTVNWVANFPNSGTAICKVNVTATSPSAFTGTYTIPSESSNMLMAMALTAISSGKTVQFQTSSDGTIYSLYLVN